MAVCSWGWGAEGSTVEAMSSAWGARTTYNKETKREQHNRSRLGEKHTMLVLVFRHPKDSQTGAS